MSEDRGHTRPDGDIVLYQPQEGSGQIRVLVEGETVWLTQNLLAELYQTTKQNISLHIKNIYEDGELAPEATVKKYLTVRQEGPRTVRRPLDHYNLDMIIAVGYRVKSPVATRFRQWATARLSEFLVKGFTLNDERLKGTDGLVDYFDELLARIREIRASEARVYEPVQAI
ncbi:MAG: RhuM family protein [Pseudomonadota bacterium]